MSSEAIKHQFCHHAERVKGRMTELEEHEVDLSYILRSSFEESESLGRVLGVPLTVEAPLCAFRGCLR